MSPQRRPRRATRARDLVLALGSVALLFAYLALPASVNSRNFVLRNFRMFPDEWARFRRVPDHEERFRRYLSLNYQVPEQLRANLAADAVALLPPRDYLVTMVPAGMTYWTDPRFVYYVAGPVRVVRWGGPRVETATHAVMVTPRPPEPGSEGPSAEKVRINVRLMVLDAPEMWDRVREAFGPGGGGPGGQETGDDHEDALPEGGP